MMGPGRPLRLRTAQFAAMFDACIVMRNGGKDIPMIIQIDKQQQLSNG